MTLFGIPPAALLLPPRAPLGNKEKALLGRMAGAGAGTRVGDEDRSSVVMEET